MVVWYGLRDSGAVKLSRCWNVAASHRCTLRQPSPVATRFPSGATQIQEIFFVFLASSTLRAAAGFAVSHFHTTEAVSLTNNARLSGVNAHPVTGAPSTL